MKRITLIALLILTVSMVSMGNNIVAKGQSNTAFGDYKIEKLDDHMVLKGKELDQYMITYEKTNIKVMIVIDKQKKCKKYYVLTDQLPVQYECNGTYFGIKKLDKDLAAKGFTTSLDNLNREEFYHQKVLTSETTVTLDHLQLIASYYPGLFKEKLA
ncbi:MAG: hypothetical protein WCK18_10830 [Prolixibacteraceae bacterium]|jgi:uncharacterized CHY-type Zn-finger protein